MIWRNKYSMEYKSHKINKLFVFMVSSAAQLVRPVLSFLVLIKFNWSLNFNSNLTFIKNFFVYSS